jgi:hypothetical protein
MTSPNNLYAGPSPSSALTETLASLPDFALRSLAETTPDINVVRMVVQELYLRLELRAWTDLEADEANADASDEANAEFRDEDEYPASLQREEYETSLLRARRESASRYPYGD